MKTKTKFFSLLFGSIAIGTAAIVPSVMLSSCSGGETLPSDIDFTPVTNVPPAAAETMQDCTFAQAQTKLNEYFKANASIERLNSDLTEYAKKLSQSQTTPEATIDIFFKATPGSKTNTINFYQKSVGTVKQTGLKQEYYLAYYDVEIKPVIIKDNNTGAFKCGWSIPMGNDYYNYWNISYDATGVTEVGIPFEFGGYFKKEDLINNVKNKYNQNQSAFEANDGYIIIQNMYSTTPQDPSCPDNPSTYELCIIKNYNQPLKICENNNNDGIFSSSSMQLTFANITDAASNMQPQPPYFSQPTFPKQ